MSYSREKYYVMVYDKEVQLSYMPTKGGNVRISEHDRFEDAFESWKNEFLHGGRESTPYIQRDGSTVFNGYDSLDATEPILELKRAAGEASKNENFWRM